MSANPWSAITAGVSSGLTFVFKICEVTYALRAVDQQTREYLITAQHAWTNIKTCRELLSHQQDLLPLSERRDYERVLEETKRAAEEVALLLEPARVDQDADCRIHFSTRVMWVLSDNSSVTAALKRLNIVHTTLTQNISTLRLLRSYGTAGGDPARGRRDRPPSYNTSQLLQWKHMSRSTPKPSTDNLRARALREQPLAHAQGTPNLEPTTPTSPPIPLPSPQLPQSPPPPAQSPLPTMRELPSEMPADVPAQFFRNVPIQKSPISEPWPSPVRSESSTLVEAPCGDEPMAPLRATASAPGSATGTGSITGSTLGAGEYQPRSWLEHQAMKSSMLRERRARVVNRV
ncbi:hypothetical protein FOPE_09750 [Fonsecaea pedrosoi]|nr:hypothetical protein FOPE_09750 [Fonsecaea pedrosoi]